MVYCGSTAFLSGRRRSPLKAPGRFRRAGRDSRSAGPGPPPSRSPAAPRESTRNRSSAIVPCIGRARPPSRGSCAGERRQIGAIADAALFGQQPGQRRTARQAPVASTQRRVDPLPVFLLRVRNRAGLRRGPDPGAPVVRLGPGEDLLGGQSGQTGAVAGTPPGGQQARQANADGQAAQAVAQRVVHPAPGFARRVGDRAGVTHRPGAGALMVSIGPGQNPPDGQPGEVRLGPPASPRGQQSNQRPPARQPAPIPPQSAVHRPPRLAARRGWGRIGSEARRPSPVVGVGPGEGLLDRQRGAIRVGGVRPSPVQQAGERSTAGQTAVAFAQGRMNPLPRLAGSLEDGTGRGGGPGARAATVGLRPGANLSQGERGQLGSGGERRGVRPEAGPAMSRREGLGGRYGGRRRRPTTFLPPRRRSGRSASRARRPCAGGGRRPRRGPVPPSAGAGVGGCADPVAGPGAGPGTCRPAGRARRRGGPRPPPARSRPARRRRPPMRRSARRRCARGGRRPRRGCLADAAAAVGLDCGRSAARPTAGAATSRRVGRAALPARRYRLGATSRRAARE